MTIIESSIAIAAPIEAVFDFHTDTKNLGLISPPWMKAELIRESGKGLGKIIEMRVMQYNFFPSHWLVRIEEFDRPFRLTDLVLSGPMKYFKHTRTFSQPCASLTELKDRLEYEVPFGLIGRIANSVSIRKMMEQMFEYRHQKTKEILEERFYIKEVPAADVGRV
ncbi:MAG: SRPBCC family protein [Bacteroidota bacterium]|nr:SRPBCC family protein [Bacteroidota bacterium]MDP4230078.1 SRPBCC family protein [Bacteroidota bacterium]MDP4235737.1 SRPBCC family protein [Bacteroidota bacterium]